MPRNKWGYIKLTDEEILHCVNLHFISNYYGYKPIEVINMRNSNKNFIEINKEIKLKKGKFYKVKQVKKEKYTKKGKKN
jgi:hypothetical protein